MKKGIIKLKTIEEVVELEDGLLLSSDSFDYCFKSKRMITKGMINVFGNFVEICRPSSSTVYDYYVKSGNNSFLIPKLWIEDDIDDLFDNIFD